jgi:hypothetical protein
MVDPVQSQDELIADDPETQVKEPMFLAMVKWQKTRPLLTPPSNPEWYMRETLDAQNAVAKELTEAPKKAAKELIECLTTCGLNDSKLLGAWLKDNKRGISGGYRLVNVGKSAGAIRWEMQPTKPQGDPSDPSDPV